MKLYPVSPLWWLLMFLLTAACTQQSFPTAITTTMPGEQKTTPDNSPTSAAAAGETPAATTTSLPMPAPRKTESLTPMPTVATAAALDLPCGPTTAAYPESSTPVIVESAQIEAATAASTLVLYMIAAESDGVDYWALKTWPPIVSATGSVLDTFYGQVQPGLSAPDVATFFFNFRPQPSPDGRYILLPSDGYQVETGLWLLDLQGNEAEGALRRLLPQPQIATWSSDSQYITYINGNNLCTLAVATAAVPMPLFTHPDLWPLYAHWSPDGQWIAAAIKTPNESNQAGGPENRISYWLIPTTGGPARILGDNPGFAIEYTTAEISWSPDSQFLLAHNTIFDLAGKRISPPFPGVSRWLPDGDNLLVIWK